MAADDTNATVTSSPDTPSHPENRLAPFNPTNERAQQSIIRALQLQSDDVFFDLGCGDGRLLVTAAEQVPGLVCVGIEYDEVFVDRARQAVAQSSARDRVVSRHGDILQVMRAELSETPASSAETHSILDATCIYLFLLPKGLVTVKPLLEELVRQQQLRGRSLRIAAYMFQLHGWGPKLIDRSTKSGSPIYVYEFEGSA